MLLPYPKRIKIKMGEQIISKDPEAISFGEVMSAFKLFIKYLFGKWWLFLIVGIIGAGSGIVYATFQKAKYQSFLSFALEENGGALSGALGLAAEFGFNLGVGGRDIFSGDNILAILTSRKIIEETLLTTETLNGNLTTLADYYNVISKSGTENENSKIAKVKYPVGLARKDFSYLQDSVLFVMQKRVLQNLVAIRRDKKLNIFDISFTSPDERFSKIFTDRIVKQTTLYYTDLRTKRSQQLLNNLERRVAEMKGSARVAIKGRATIQDANINPALAEQGSLLQQKQLDASVYGAAYTELFKNLEVARYQFLNDIPLLQVIDEAKYPMKKIKLGRLKTGFIAGMLACILLVLVMLFQYQKSNIYELKK